MYNTGIKNYKYTKIYFAENQLSLGLISILPLSTSLPKILQHLPVQPIACSWIGRLVSGLNTLTNTRELAKIFNLLVHYAKGTLVK